MSQEEQRLWSDEKTTRAWLAQIAGWEEEFSSTLLKCIFHTRLIIPGTMTPSGTRYVADPQQTILVKDGDRKTLLDMTRNIIGCGGCGGGRSTEPQHYFEEVREV